MHYLTRGNALQDISGVIRGNLIFLRYKKRLIICQQPTLSLSGTGGGKIIMSEIDKKKGLSALFVKNFANVNLITAQTAGRKWTEASESDKQNKEKEKGEKN